MGGWWFAKKASPDAGLAKQGNVQRMASLLGNAVVGSCRVFVCALRPSEMALVSPDMGTTLPAHASAAAFTPEIHALLDLLLAKGIEWKGFAPRNPVVQPERQHLWLIDLEATEFYPDPAPAIRRTVRLKWVLNWRQVWPATDAFVKWLESLPVLAVRGPHELDPFEQALHDTVGDALDLTAMLDLSDAATLAAEAPVSDGRAGLSPLDVGHILDEALLARTSVLMTFLVAALRRRDPLGFDRLMTDLSQRISAAGPNLSQVQLRDTLFAILDACCGAPNTKALFFVRVHPVGAAIFGQSNRVERGPCPGGCAGPVAVFFDGGDQDGFSGLARALAGFTQVTGAKVAVLQKRRRFRNCKRRASGRLPAGGNLDVRNAGMVWRGGGRVRNGTNRSGFDRQKQYEPAHKRVVAIAYPQQRVRASGMVVAGVSNRRRDLVAKPVGL